MKEAAPARGTRTVPASEADWRTLVELSPEGDDDRLIFDRQNRGLWLFRSWREICDGLDGLPPSLWRCRGEFVP
jgi:hypothetical protein